MREKITTFVNILMVGSVNDVSDEIFPLLTIHAPLPSDVGWRRNGSCT